MMKDFPKFKAEMEKKNPNINPQEMVSQMVSSGKVSQAQFEKARSLAAAFGIKI
jgi:hypothetical protein